MVSVPILNGRFHALTTAQVVDWAAAWIREGRRGYLCTVNVAILMMMRRDPRLQTIVDRAALAVADGLPIVWASRWLARPLPERVAGVDLVQALAARAATEGFGVYLLGARGPVVTGAAAALRARHPGLHIAGLADGYFGAAEAVDRARQIRESGARILLVGMGVPRQEYFLEEQWDRLGVSLALGLGGTFEVLAGVRTRAPRPVQRAGLEWVWRLGQEPRRLGTRYLVTNWQFVRHVAGGLVRTRLFGG